MSPDKAFNATNSPTEFLTIINEALTTALDKTSPPIFFSQIISWVSESMAITKPLTSDTINLPKPEATPAANSRLRLIFQFSFPDFGFSETIFPLRISNQHIA